MFGRFLLVLGALVIGIISQPVNAERIEISVLQIADQFPFGELTSAEQAKADTFIAQVEILIAKKGEYFRKKLKGALESIFDPYYPTTREKFSPSIQKILYELHKHLNALPVRKTTSQGKLSYARGGQDMQKLSLVYAEGRTQMCRIDLPVMFADVAVTEHEDSKRQILEYLGGEGEGIGLNPLSKVYTSTEYSTQINAITEEFLNNALANPDANDIHRAISKLIQNPCVQP